MALRCESIQEMKSLCVIQNIAYEIELDDQRC